MATLDSIKGSILEETFPYRPGQNDPTGGVVDAVVVDANNASLGNQSIGNRRKSDIEKILTAGGHTITNMSNEVKTNAQQALNWACIHDFVKQSKMGVPFGGKGCETKLDFMARLQAYKDLVCQFLHNINLSWDEFCLTPYSIFSVTTRNHCASNHNHINSNGTNIY